uniref:CD34 molecule n=1 Tax=Pelusios castaneus TaxID=367368 RepID=A0A8C8SIP9_9SAUR
MLLLGTLKAMKRKQLFWTMFCVLSLREHTISGQNIHTTTATISPSVTDASNTSVSSAMTTVSPTIASEYSSVTSQEKLNTVGIRTGSEEPVVVTSPEPTQTQLNLSKSSVSANSSLHPQQSTSLATSPGTTRAMTSETVLKTSTIIPEPTSHTGTTSHPVSSSVKPFSFACQNANHVKESKVICLLLREPETCENFIVTKGASLSMLICDPAPCQQHSSPSACHLNFTTSAVNDRCMLLIQACSKDMDAVEDLLQHRESQLNKLGIKSHSVMSMASPPNVSRKTLIALVASGLLLAFLGVAGYFLMKRRSWSPMGERLGEDPYYTENSSQGNTVITVASPEPSEPREKPNLNGGTQKNGTGQASSKNGHSARQHVVADTEL